MLDLAVKAGVFRDAGQASRLVGIFLLQLLLRLNFDHRDRAGYDACRRRAYSVVKARRSTLLGRRARNEAAHCAER